MSGPWPPCVPDKEIFKFLLAKCLAKDEIVEADSGYSDTKHAATPGVGKTIEHRKRKSQARGRQEAFNGRFKKFGSIAEKFRHHGFEQHHTMFTAVVVLTQIGVENGEEIFDVVCDGNYYAEV